jgi:NAD(P)-dependent dehydrogenase (short-subunit alcohol dehydrogenase family)/acyl dehydratase/putative sterol carrier protein
MALNLDGIGKKLGPVTREYGWRDLVLYALGVGAGYDELDFVYENRLQVLPSFAILSIYDFFSDFMTTSGVNLMGIVHGEHELILHSPIPPEGGRLTSEGQITAMYDKGPGKGALVIGEVDTYFEDGRKLYTNVVTLFSRLDGGFGGEPGPSESFAFPDREPDIEEVMQPAANQPLIYRLSGDTFALHVDPDFARASGFREPIMHGLCTHGFACRAVVKHLFPGEPQRLTRFRNRFSRPLYPGQPIKVQIWKIEEGRALWRTLNVETGEVTIDRGLVEWMSRQEAERRSQVQGIRFDGRVAIVTGAGGGLGRTYALELARRGARVVVNDLGGTRDGSGQSTSAADAVVREITEAGGHAVANYDSVTTPEGGQAIVRAALEHFGRLDILVNNAGILRDKSFAKMEPEMWDAVLSVHLQGAFHVTRPAFLAMREQGYGRIVLTTSAAGLFGNFGQCNYGAAKMGLVGLMNSLKIEGARYGIQVNTVAPLATTRLTEDVLPPDLAAKLKPEFVTPLVLYLCSEQCPVSGGIYNAGMGHFGRAAVVSGHGVYLGDGDRMPTPEAVAAHWQQILSLQGAEPYDDANAALMAMLSGDRQPDMQAAGGDAGAAAVQRPGPAPSAEPAAGGTVQAVFDRLPQAFQAGAAAGTNVVFQFRISGPGGGDWYAAVQDGALSVEAGIHPKPTTTLKMSGEDFLKYVGGQLPAMQAYSAGKLKIEGDLMKSQLVEKLFKFRSVK